MSPFVITTALSAENNPLSLDLWNILFHMINLVILIVALYFLLFKPTKKFMAKRKEEIVKITRENEELQESTKKIKEEYDDLIEKAKAEAAKANEEALKAAKSRAEAVEEEARQKAKEIVEHANQSVEAEKERLANDVKTQVSVISVEIAKKVLSREITPEDDSALIDQCLKEWKGEHEND